MRGEDIKIKRPEQFVREFRIKEGSQKKVDRRQKDVEKRRLAKVPTGSIKDTVGLVVRIHEGRHSSQAIKKAMRALGLVDKYDAVFMKLDEDNISTAHLLTTSSRMHNTSLTMRCLRDAQAIRLVRRLRIRVQQIRSRAGAS